MDPAAFEVKLNEQKHSIEHRLGITRYPYRTLDNISLLERLLLLANIQFPTQGKVLDAGCGDGDFGLYLAAQGRKVDFIDFPETNHNQMQMIQELVCSLPSHHSILTLDLDRGLGSLESNYSFAIAFGLLYHLKNPYLFLEDLAMRTSFASISTRIIESSILPDKQAAAYLVADNELGTDNTNFWLFNSAGLTRLVERCGWRVLSRIRFGNKRSGDTGKSDAREAILLASRYSVFGDIRFTYGLNRVEYSSYRWTQPHFGIECSNQAVNTLSLNYYLPPEWMDEHELEARFKDEILPLSISRHSDGCRADITLPHGRHEAISIDIQCRHAKSSNADARPLGVVLKLSGSETVVSAR